MADEIVELKKRLADAEAIIAKVVIVRREQDRYFNATPAAWSYKEAQLKRCKGLEKELEEMIGQYRAPQTSLLG